MLGLACCLGKHQKNDKLVEDDSRNLHKNEQQQTPLTNQDQPVVDQSFEPPSTSATCQVQNPDLPVKPRTEVIDEIVEHLKMEDVFRVILHGKQGVGKTWIAKEVAKQCILKNIVDATIWIYVNAFELILIQESNNLSHQLSLQEDFGGYEYYLNNKDDDDNTVISLKNKLKGKRVLLVLDDEIPKGRIEMVMKNLEGILGSGSKYLPKVLMTKLEGTDDTITTSDDIIESDNSDNIDDSKSRIVILKIKPLTLSESKDLLQRTWIVNNTGMIGDDDVEEIVKQCNFLPAAIVFTSNMLWYALRNEPSELNKKLAVREAKRKGGDEYWALGYEKFINNVTILKCFWFSKDCLKERLITYNELILYWMLEGYFDETASSEKGYANAHNVLMDLLDAGILGEREGGYVVLERAGVNFAYYLFPLVCEKLPQVDLSYIKNFARIESGVNVWRLNGSIAAFERKKTKGDSIVILLVRGNSISKEDSFKFSMEHDPTNRYYSAVAESLNILYVSNVELFLSLAGMSDLQVLILRNCNVTNFQILRVGIGGILNVLDISECEMLNEIPADFLTYHKNVILLNLSGSPIKYMRRPAIFLGLRQLRHLILRYTLLESFPEVSGLDKLEVLDLSGAKFDSLKKKVWNLELSGLMMLDLSETCIYEFPGLVALKNLTYLLLKNCPLLNKLRPVTTLTRLQVIVASGCRELRYFREMNLPSGNCLRKLDLSNTMIRKIPPLKDASNLVYLCLSGCHQLKELPPIEGAKNLRLLDASDAIQLEKIHTSFQDMKSLTELFLSNTNIQTLPPLSGLESLQKLHLRGCKSLRTIPEDTGLLTNLFVVDLRGCIALETLLDEQFIHVTVLKDYAP